MPIKSELINAFGSREADTSAKKLEKSFLFINDNCSSSQSIQYFLTMSKCSKVWMQLSWLFFPMNSFRTLIFLARQSYCPRIEDLTQKHLEQYKKSKCEQPIRKIECWADHRLCMVGDTKGKISRWHFMLILTTGEKGEARSSNMW